MSLKKLLERLSGTEPFKVKPIYKLPFKLKMTTLPTNKWAAFYFFERAFQVEKRKIGVFHPSEISNQDMLCKKYLYFVKVGQKKDARFKPLTDDNRFQRLFDLGTMVHLYIQYSLYVEGFLLDFETDVEDLETMIGGKCDGLIHFKGTDEDGIFYDEEMVLEIKTMSSFQFNKLRTPLESHLRQGSIYGGVLGYKRVAFLYYCKDNSELKCFVRDVDGKYFSFLKQELKTVLGHVKFGRIPRGVCSDSSCERAEACPFRDSCFSL